MDINTNSYSRIARDIMKAGLKRDILSIPNKFFEVAKEVFNVPEKPIDYEVENCKDLPERAVLVTGGLDSSALYFQIKNQYPQTKAVYIDIGQSYVVKELGALEKLGIEYKYIDDSFLNTLIDRSWEHIIPARNFYFFCLVAERMKGGIIYFGSTDGEMPNEGGDKSKKFLKQVNKLFQKLPYPVRIETPLKNKTKTDLVKWWIQYSSIELLDNTISCFNEQDGHCGKCQACLRKAMAYVNNGLELKTMVPIIEGCQVFIKKYKTLMPDALRKRDFSHYSRRRCIQDLHAIRLLQQENE